MLVRMLLAAAFFAGLYFLIRYLRRSSIAVPWILRAVAVAGTGGLLLVLIVRGGAEIAVPLLTVLVPLLVRWFGSRPLSFSPATAAPVSSGQSAVATRFLQMTLDHATGVMSGMVREGRFTGHSLQDLALENLLELWWECQSDPQSVAVLEAYLDRRCSPEWRDRLQDGKHSGPSAESATDPAGGMSQDEAYQILGLQPGASREEIQVAYRRLIQRLHPDRGGSAYLAARLNQAREVLLGV